MMLHQPSLQPPTREQHQAGKGEDKNTEQF